MCPPDNVVYTMFFSAALIWSPRFSSVRGNLTLPGLCSPIWWSTLTLPRHTDGYHCSGYIVAFRSRAVWLHSAVTSSYFFNRHLAECSSLFFRYSIIPSRKKYSPLPTVYFRFIFLQRHSFIARLINLKYLLIQGPCEVISTSQWSHVLFVDPCFNYYAWGYWLVSPYSTDHQLVATRCKR